MHLVLWTIRACLILYAICLIALMFRRRAAAKWLYVMAALLYLAHVAAAFHYVHGWSHGRAHAHVARVTYEYIGWASGFGLYFNYLLAAVWTADATHWLWVGDERRGRRRRWIGFAIHGFLLFLAFNATVVFAPMRTRVAGTIAFAALAAAAWVAKRRPAAVA
jgi:hypothetical protein